MTGGPGPGHAGQGKSCAQLICLVPSSPVKNKIAIIPNRTGRSAGCPHLLAQRACLCVSVLPLRACQILWPSAAVPRVIYRVSSCCVRSGVSGRVLSTSRPVVRWLMASRLAERSMACWPARCQ